MRQLARKHFPEILAVASAALRTAWRRAAPAAGVAFLLAACADTHSLMPVPAIYRGSEAVPLFTSVPQGQRSPTLDLLYLTNRAPTVAPADDPPYGTNRSRSLAFGAAEISFGGAQDWEALAGESIGAGQDARPTLSLGGVRELGRFPEIPYRMVSSAGGLARAPDIVDGHEAAARALQSEIARRLAASPRKEVVLYVHGYNNRFRDAAFTISELCHFLGREFVCAVFSWPAGGSRGLLFGYNFDRESSEYSVHHLKQAIRLVAQTPGLERLHLVAHSRGTDLLTQVTEALMIESYVMREPWYARHRVANIVLVAPDIDAEIATSRLFSIFSDPDLPLGAAPAPRVALPPGPTRITIYATPDDRAIGVARILFGSLRRLGGLDPTTIPPERIESARPLEGVIDVIQVPHRTGWIGHDYFTADPGVSSDLIRLIRFGRSPGTSARPMRQLGSIFWRLD
jgi:esterase/lipase superfamily enzyme